MCAPVCDCRLPSDGVDGPARRLIGVPTGPAAQDDIPPTDLNDRDLYAPAPSRINLWLAVAYF